LTSARALGLAIAPTTPGRAEGAILSHLGLLCYPIGNTSPSNVPECPGAAADQGKPRVGEYNG